MIHRHTSLSLPQAERVLFKLCKHFALKVPVRFDTERAEVDFPFGSCLILRQGEQLDIACSALDEARMDKMRHVLDEHLALMARQPQLQPRWLPGERPVLHGADDAEAPAGGSSKTPQSSPSAGPALPSEARP